MNQDSNFIEVLGESSFIETPEKYPVEMEIELTATQEETHKILEKFNELENAALELLHQYKNELEKLIDGGRRIRSSYVRRKFETVVSRKFILHFTNIEILERVWRSALTFNSTKTQSITFEPSQPFFSAKKEHEQRAHDEAINRAKERALHLAKSSGLTLGSLLFAKQLALRERHSGAYSDGDWWGDAERFQEYYHIGSSSSQVNLEEPERIIYVRYLVRFGVQSA